MLPSVFTTRTLCFFECVRAPAKAPAIFISSDAKRENCGVKTCLLSFLEETNIQHYIIQVSKAQKFEQIAAFSASYCAKCRTC